MPNCLDCFYEYHGECRFNPPVTLTGKETIYPPVDVINWCGQFKTKPVDTVASSPVDQLQAKVVEFLSKYPDGSFLLTTDIYQDLTGTALENPADYKIELAAIGRIMAKLGWVRARQSSGHLRSWGYIKPNAVGGINAKP